MIGDDVVYLGDDDKLYRATPGGIAGSLKQIGAGMASDIPAIAGGVAGGVLGAPMGPAGIVGLSALGAAGGKGYSRALANVALEEPQTVGGNIQSMLVEGAVEGVGSLLGLGVAKWLQRNAARDIARLQRPGTQTAMSELQKKAGAQGIELTPAEITNLPSLKAQQKVLTSMPRSSDTMEQFLVRRTGQVENAVDRFLKTLSPVESAEQAGMMVREAADKAISEEVKKRALAAGPLYKQAFADFAKSPGVPEEMLPVAQELMKRPAMKAAGKRAVSLAANEGIDLTKAENTLLGMHYMKLALDDMIGAPQEGIGAIQRRQFVDLKKQLVGMMDDLSPGYARARQTYAHFSPAVTQLKEGPVAALAELKDEKLVNLAKRMFNPETQGPLSVSQARVAIESADPAAWDAIKRAYIQQEFEKAGKMFASRPEKSLQTGKFWAAMAGGKRQREILKEALTTKEYEAFFDLLDVMEAASRVPKIGSDTAWNEAGKKALESEATGLGTKIAKTAGNPLGVLKRIEEWIGEARTGRHAERLAQIITSPDAMQKLKQLRQLSSGDQQFIAGTAALLGVLAAPDLGESPGLPRAARQPRLVPPRQ
jgi:hypothetical protein